MKKTYCDECGKEYDENEIFVFPVSGYDGFELSIIPPLDFSSKDVCEKCEFKKYNEVLQHLAQEWR